MSSHIPKPPPGFKFVGNCDRTRTPAEDALDDSDELSFCICDLEPTEDELATKQCAHCGKYLL